MKTNTAGVAQYAIPGDRFGTPGLARLVARYAGSQNLASVSASWPVMRTCHVQVQTRIETTYAEVGDLAGIRALATSACGAVPDGSIEFLVDGSSQVTLPLKQGEAYWQLSTFQFAPGNVSIAARYVAASSAWVGDETSSTKLQVRPMSSGRRALWLTSGFLIVVYFAFQWSRTNPHKYPLSRVSSAALEPQSLDVEPSSNKDFGWIGIVIDSHTGTPIAAATVSVQMPGFSATRVILTTETTAEGSFALPHADSTQLALLVVQSPRYLRAQWAMPMPGKLVVRLETRRRAIVRSFVTWADKTRHDKANWPEPTPAQIAQSARDHALSHINTWANRVETAAFGPEDPASHDDELLSPPDAGSFGAKHS